MTFYGNLGDTIDPAIALVNQLRGGDPTQVDPNRRASKYGSKEEQYQAALDQVRQSLVANMGIPDWVAYRPGAHKVQQVGLGSQIGDQQQALAQLLGGYATGEQTSGIAQGMLERGSADMQQRLRSALASSAASNRGLGFASRDAEARRQATMGMAQMAQAVPFQAAQIRAQEMESARSALAQQLAQMRAAEMEGLGMGVDVERMKQRATESELDARRAYTQAQAEGAKTQMDFALGAAEGITSMASMMSDERAKSNVRTAKDSHLRELLDALTAKRFDYRNKRDGGEDNTGIMAQDLERSEIGRTLVRETETPDGPRKVVDIKRALAAALASSAHLHKRLSKLEVK